MARPTHRVVLGNDVWIGHGVVVLRGATVGTGAAIGAGAAVSRNAPDFRRQRPGFAQLDFKLPKRFAITGSAHFELRAHAYHILNHPDFGNPPSVLGVALPYGPGAPGLQPHQAFTAATAGSAYGLRNGTVGRYVNMGTSRQIQLAVRLVV